VPVLKPVFGIFAVLGWVILVGLHVVWRYSFGWLFRTLADFLDVDIGLPHLPSIHPFGSVARWLRSLDRNVDYALVHAANQLEHVAVWLFSRVGHLLDLLVSRVKALTLGVEHAILRLIKVTIPRLVARLLKLVWRELRALSKYARKMLPKLLKQLTRFSKWAAHEIAKGTRHLGFLWKWAKATFKAIWPLLRALGKRLGRLEKALTKHGFLNLLLPALRALDITWITARNIILVGKWIVTLDYGSIYEYVRNQVVFVLNENVCLTAEFTYDLAVFVLEPVLKKEIALTMWICHPERGDVPSGCSYPTRYAGEWEPSATPTEESLAWGKERLAPGVPLPDGVILA
jgi:hypothetical protein